MLTIAGGIVLGVVFLCLIPVVLTVCGYLLVGLFHLPGILLRALWEGIKELKELPQLFMQQMREPVSLPLRRKHPFPRWKGLIGAALLCLFLIGVMVVTDPYFRK